MSLLFRMLAGIGLLWLLASSASAVPLTGGLEGYWKLDGDGTDASGNARDLTLVGGPAFGTGLLDQALLLAGSEAQHATRPGDDAAFNFGADEFTIQAWVKFNSLSNEQILLEKFTGGSGPGWTLSKLAAGTILFTSPGQGGLIVSAPGIGTSIYHHVVVRRLGDTIDVFFDGVSQGSVALAAGTALSTSTNPLLLGARDGSQVFPLRGLLDEVAVWSRGLSTDDVGALFNDGQGMALPEPGIAALLGLGLGGLALAGRRRSR